MQHILDFHWTKGTSGSFIQEMKLVEFGKTVVKKVPLRNYTFNFKLSPDRYCPGYYNEKSEYVPCPTASKLTQKKYQHCYYCEQKDGWKAAFIFGDEPNEKMKEYLAKTHLIYLAYFPDGKIKVGTSSRGSTRLIEQDALVYGFIAEAIGSEVQNFERAISKAIPGVQEFIQSKFKFKRITRKPDVQKAAMTLKQTFQKIQSHFKESEFENWLYDSISVENHLAESELYFPEREPYALSYPDALVGKSLGLRGKFILFEYDGTILAVDEREVIGRKIEDYVDEFEYGVPEEFRAESNSQLGLL